MFAVLALLVTCSSASVVSKYKTFFVVQHKHYYMLEIEGSKYPCVATDSLHPFCQIDYKTITVTVFK